MSAEHHPLSLPTSSQSLCPSTLPQRPSPCNCHHYNYLLLPQPRKGQNTDSLCPSLSCCPNYCPQQRCCLHCCRHSRPQSSQTPAAAVGDVSATAAAKAEPSDAIICICICMACWFCMVNIAPVVYGHKVALQQCIFWISL